VSLRHVADRDHAKHEREVRGGRSCLGAILKFCIVVFVVLYVFVSVIGILNPS
jgi:hypothetical protein